MKYNKEYKSDLVTTNKDCYVEGTAVFKGDKLTLHINKVSINNYDLNHTIIKNYQYKILSKNKIVFGFGYDSLTESIKEPIMLKELMSQLNIDFSDAIGLDKQTIIKNNIMLEFVFTDIDNNVINKDIAIILVSEKEASQPDK